MSNLQSQIDEIEALNCIYPDEFTHLDKYDEIVTMMNWDASTITNAIKINLKPPSDGDIHGK